MRSNGDTWSQWNIAANIPTTALDFTNKVNGINSAAGWITGAGATSSFAPISVTPAAILATGTNSFAPISVTPAAILATGTNSFDSLGAAAASNASSFSSPYIISWASSNYISYANGNDQAYNVTNATTIWPPNSTECPTNYNWNFILTLIPNGQSITLTNASWSGSLTLTNAGATKLLFHKDWGNSTWFINMLRY